MSSGFLAMSGIIPFPPLGTMAGLGGLNDELIPFPEDPSEGFNEGVGLDVQMQAFSPAGPKTTIIFSEHEAPPSFSRGPVQATGGRPPKLTISRPEKKK